MSIELEVEVKSSSTRRSQIGSRFSHVFVTMSAVSLKERLKQFQALKESAQAKSEAAKARDDELRTLAMTSTAKDSIRKLQYEAEVDDTTAGTETQTTAGETAASPATGAASVAVPEEEAGKSNLRKLGHATTNTLTLSLVEEEILEEEIDDGIEEEVVEDDEEVVEEEVVEEIEEVVEEIEDGEDEEVVEEVVEEVEEVVIEVDDDKPEETTDQPEPKEEGAIDTDQATQSAVPLATRSEDTVDEKSLDEFAGERHPILSERENGLDDAEEIPMDELAHGEFAAPERVNSVDVDMPNINESPFDEEPLPIFRALDAEEEKRSTLPVFLALEDDEERADRSTKLATLDKKSEKKSATKSRAAVVPITESDDIEQGRRSNPNAGLPRGFNDPSRRRFRGIICCLIVVGICAIAALVLPFFIDYDSLGQSPTSAPTISFAPSSTPSDSPTESPTTSQAPSYSPTETPSASPTTSPAPTDNPTESPTVDPSESPTPSPTAEPSPSPTESPTLSPSVSPSKAPVEPTDSPTAATPEPTSSPTPNPTDETPAPTEAPPTTAPVAPTLAPVSPTVEPTPAPVTSTPAPVIPTLAPQAPQAPTEAPVAEDSLAPTTLRLGQFIQVFLVPISGEEVFEDQSSPQFRAAQYLSEEDDYVSEIGEEAVLSDRYALTTFYFATGGDEWDRCALGDEACAGAWLTGDACEWEYVSCDADGRVVSFNFGKFPQALSL